MRRSALTVGALLLAGSLAACSPSSDDGDATPEGTSPPSSSSDDGGATPTATSPTATPTTSPTASEQPPSEPAVDIPVQVQEDAILAPDVLGTADQPREESGGVTAWRLPETCDQATPDARDMWTVTQGSGEFEEPVGVQQIAVFADSDDAAAAADALVAAMESCTASEGSPTRYVVEGIDIGAQGNGLVTDYYGASADGDLASAIGSYVAETRRGTAVTLVGYEGGESQVESAGRDVRQLLATAWERLCAYDSEGC